MNTLFIDTHDEIIKVAILLSDKLYVKEQASYHEHAKYLMNMIKDIIEENNIDIKDINNIVAVNGPGSFTGLRIGLSSAKTLAYCLNIPIYLVSSLESYIISSNLDKCISIIQDNKGYYVGIKDKNYKEIYTESLENYNNLEVVNDYNIEKIIRYALLLKDTPAHLVRANYVKTIEVEK